MTTSLHPPPVWTLTHPTQSDCHGYLIHGLTASYSPRYIVVVQCGAYQYANETHSDRNTAESRLGMIRGIMEQRGWTSSEPMQPSG